MIPWKTFDRGYVHVNIRGLPHDPSKPFHGWVLPIHGSHWANAITTKYGRPGLTAVFVPKEWVTTSRTKPARIVEGYFPPPEHMAVIPSEAMRPKGTVDWMKVFDVDMGMMKRNPSEAWVAGPTYPSDYPERYLDWLEKSFPGIDLSSKEGRMVAEREYSGWQEWMSNPAKRTAVRLSNQGCANPARPSRTMRFDSGLDR